MSFESKYGFGSPMRQRSVRDAQRGKIYAAERDTSFFMSKATMSFEEVRAYALLCLSKWKEVYPSEYPVRVSRHGLKIVNKGKRYVCAHATDVSIHMPTWAHNELVTIHEMSHVIATSSERHGWKFASVYLRLLEIMLGKDKRDELARSFAKYGAKYTDPLQKMPAEYIAASVGPKRTTLKTVQKLLTQKHLQMVIVWRKTHFMIMVGTMDIYKVPFNAVNDLTLEQWEEQFFKAIVVKQSWDERVPL